MVLGHHAAEIEPTLAGEGVRVVVNPRPEAGMLASLQAGLAAAPPAEWLLFALGDQPALRPETVDLLLREAALGLPEGQSIAVPSHAGRRGHPLVLHDRHRAEIAALDPALGLRDLLRRRPEAIRHVEVADAGVLADMDTPEDYRRELGRLEAAAEP